MSTKQLLSPSVMAALRQKAGKEICEENVKGGNVVVPTNNPEVKSKSTAHATADSGRQADSVSTPDDGGKLSAGKQLLSPAIMTALRQKAEREKEKRGKDTSTITISNPTDKENSGNNLPIAREASKSPGTNPHVDLTRKSFRGYELTGTVLSELIARKHSFMITDLDAEGARSQMIEQLEQIMELHGMRWRVRTWGREAVIAAAAIPTGVTQAVGVSAAIGIGIHDFATYNPDYEIVKYINKNDLSVEKRKVTMVNGKPKTKWQFLAEIAHTTVSIASQELKETCNVFEEVNNASDDKVKKWAKGGFWVSERKKFFAKGQKKMRGLDD